jgi:O-antigen/teichoic acid export membrane protein
VVAGGLPATVATAPRRFLSQLGSAASLSAAIALAIGTGASLLAPQIMVGLFGEAYRSAATPFLLLSWSAAIALVQIHFSNAVLALGADFRYLIGTLTAALLNVALDLLLIPSMGPSGGAIATIAAEAFVMLYMLRRVVVRLGKPQFEWSRIIRGALAAAVLGAALVPLRTVLTVWPCLAAGALIYVSAAAALGVVRLDELRALRRGENDSDAATA